MLSLQKCRSLLGADCKLTDAELELLREDLYAFADVAVGAFCAQKKVGSGIGPMSQNVSGCLSVIPGPEREAVEERAAILECQGGLKKPEAERQAFGEWVQSKKRPESKPRRSSGKRKARKKKPQLL